MKDIKEIREYLAENSVDPTHEVWLIIQEALNYGTISKVEAERICQSALERYESKLLLEWKTK